MEELPGIAAPAEQVTVNHKSWVEGANKEASTVENQVLVLVRT
jgi:hypothetical protein